MASAAAHRLHELLRRVLNHEVLRLAVLVAVAAFLLDWATKSWALYHLDETISPIGSLTLGVARNDGFAFSTGAGVVPAWVIVATRVAALIVIVLVAKRVAKVSRRNAFGIALLLAGGFGNAADLMFRGGAVIDFIGAGPFTFDWSGRLVHIHFIFNAADVFIFIGVVLVTPLIRHVGRAAQRRFAIWEDRLLQGGASTSG